MDIPRDTNKDLSFDLSNLGKAELQAMEQLLESANDISSDEAAYNRLLNELREALTRAQEYNADRDPLEKLLGTALLGGYVSCEEGMKLFGASEADHLKKYQVFAVKLAEDNPPQPKLEKLTGKIQNSVNTGKALVVDDAIVIVSLSSSEEASKTIVKQINSVVDFEKIECYVGVSEATPHFDLLSVCFNHAAFAADLACKRCERVVLYRNSMFDYFVDQSCIIEKFAYFRDIRVLGLYESDRDNGSDLLNTTITYIESGFSLGRTAQAMHLHRNSVVYRLNRIAERTEIDLMGSQNNYDVFTLLMTCKIYRSKLNKNDIPDEWNPNC